MSRPLLCAAILVLASAAPASAHALGADCKIRKDRVEVEVYFSDDTPARGATVTVENSAKQIVARGATDDAGTWSFAVPTAGRYEVAVDAGDGHRKDLVLTVLETPADASAANSGPSRAEFTATPWLRVGIGLFLIAAVAIAIRMSRSRAGRAVVTNSSSP